VAALTAPAVGTAQQQRGVLLVRVTDQAGAPLSQAQIQVVGTALGGLTNAEGRATVTGVPLGPQTVRVVRIGFAEAKSSVTVAAGTPLPVELRLTPAAINLTPVVTTATGQQRRVEIGNSIASVDAAKVAEQSPIASISDLLNARAPGVVINTGTQSGTGSRTRIRGINSISLSNEPIYVIDGIRMTSNAGSATYGTGGNTASRVGDLNPEEIENVEIVKGPSAATLYGTDAANGVIVITTKKGRSGAPRWTTYAEGGVIEDRNTYPLNYTIAGRSPGSSTYRECTLPQVSAGSCLLDSVRIYSPFHDADATPLGTGYRNQFGVQVSGGADQLRYFLSAEREEETGVLTLPAFERRRFDSTNTPIREWTDRPNVMDRLSFRANLNSTFSPKLDVGVTTNLVFVEQRYSLESNATAGLGSHVFGGPGYKGNGTVSGLGSPLNGYRAWTPGYTWQEKTGQDVTRFIMGLNVNWRPTSWNTTRLNIGNDFTARDDENLLNRGEGPPITATYRLGFKGSSRTNLQNFSIDAATAGDFRIRSDLLSKTTLGLQFVDYSFRQTNGTGTELAVGTQTTGGGAIRTTTEGTTLNRTLGVFIEESVAWRDRLFATFAVRSDQNSAFGSEFQSVVYPKASLSWIVSDEGWFPEWGWLDNIRLRSAWGAAGVQPGPNDALRYFGSVQTNVRNLDTPGVQYASLGNLDLKPERTSEWEGGFDARLWGGRASLELTYYDKRTRDAIISAIVPPSVGGPATQRANIGAVRNNGWEMLLTTVVVSRPWLTMDLTLNGSTNANEVLSLGETPPQIGVTTRIVEGYPVNGFWAQRITGWEDKNGDGILTYNANAALNEVFVADSATFVGYNQPRHILALTSGFELLNRRLRIQALTDYRGGHYWYNNTERIRCVSRQNCNGLMNPNASFEEQAMVVATRDHPSRTLDGFLQKGDFVRLRELGATYQLPATWATLARARTASVTVTARNLGRWTRYRGVDPETDRLASQDSDAPDEFQTIGPPSYFVFRVNFGF
jgi:TonB-linked SusC/RagA family outer membrane protein